MVMIKKPNQYHGLVARLILAFGILCVGFAAIFVKLANVPGSVSAFYRTLTAGSLVIPWWLIRSKERPVLKDLLVTALGGTLFALTLALWNTSVLFTSAATAALLVNSAPIWVGLGSFIFFRERLPKSYWIGLAIAMGGMIWLLGADAYEQLHFSSGNLLALGSSILYAAYLMITQQTRSKVDLLTFMAVSLLFSIISLLVFNLSIGANLTGYPTNVWVALICLGLVSQLGGWLCINYALGHIKAAQVSVWLLAESIVTAIIAIPLLHEYLKMNQLVGGIMVLMGIFLVTKKQ